MMPGANGAHAAVDAAMRRCRGARADRYGARRRAQARREMRYVHAMCRRCEATVCCCGDAQARFAYIACAMMLRR